MREDRFVPNAILATAVASATLLFGASSPLAAPASIHEPANGCWALRADHGKYVARAGGGYAADAATLAEAAGFTMKATGLGSYLLLSKYERAPGEIGRKELLGIVDPAGELLDAAGKLVTDAGIHVSAAGDMADYALDPVAPFGRSVRAAGEGVGSVGSRVADRSVAPAPGLVTEASDLTVWNLARTDAGRFLFSARTGGRLAANPDGSLTLVAGAPDSRTLFDLEPQTGCDPYPEAGLDASLVDPNVAPAVRWGEIDPSVGDAEVFGWVDAHAHITAYEFIGGRINYGAPFHELGVDHALGDCEENHGPNGMTAHVEMVTSEGALGPHETQGWPTYEDWPRRGSLQHHQSYHVWLRRAYLGGLRILVNLITHNEILCQVVPQKKNDCDGMANIGLQAQRTYEMQDYIDAQEGGPGKGWFRVVRTPAEAREVIAAGKLAVVLGVEMSKVLNCGEFLDQPECSREEIDERLAEIHRLGVRVFFPVHKFDNAFGGHLPHSGFALGTVLTVGNLAETGHFLEVEPCPAGDDFSGDPNDPRHRPEGILDYLLAQLEYDTKQLPSSRNTPFEPYDPRGPNGGTDTTNLCNIRGLHELGEYVVRRAMALGMILDVDHMSRRAASAVIDLTAPLGYPVISSHDWTGSERLLDRIAASGGFISRFARGGRDAWIDRLVGMEDRFLAQGATGWIGGGLASDVNGIATLPGNPSSDGRKIAYPFTSYDGRVRFAKQTTGDHVFGLYDDDGGVAHYGLYPDFIADAEAFSSDPARARRGLDAFFRSAEAYLQMWERAAAWAGR